MCRQGVMRRQGAMRRQGMCRHNASSGGRGHRQCVVTIRRQRQRQTSDPSCGCLVYIYKQ